MTLAKQRQELVDDGADVPDVDLDVRERRRPERQDDVLRLGCGAHVRGHVQATARVHPAHHVLAARLVERHLSLADQVHPAFVDVDAANGQAAVGKREREGKPHAASSDDSYVWARAPGLG